MKFCVPYSNRFKYNDKVDEIIFLYGESHNPDLLETLSTKENIVENQRYIIQVLEMEFYAKWNTGNLIANLIQKRPELNIAVTFPNYYGYAEMDKEIQILKDNKIDFFFQTRASDWDTFHGLKNLGVSDIYIVEALAFELDKLGPVAHASAISIRVFANVCQQSWRQGDQLKSFFMRPEAIAAYDSYVDIVEFFGNTNEQEVMYEVYAIHGKWFGNLNEIIVGLDMKIDSRFILPVFDAARVKCGKKCLKGGKCKICERVLEAAETFEKENLYIKKNN